MQHVFLIHSIPTDIVSDRGPQLVSQVWKAFCSALGQAWVSPWDSIYRLMVRWRDSIRIWRRLYSAWCRQTLLPGVNTCPGWNTPTIPWWVQPRGCPHSKLLWGTTLPCSHHKRRRSLFPPCSRTSTAATECWRTLEQHCVAPLPGTGWLQIVIGATLLPTAPGRRCHCQWNTFHWRGHPENWLPGSWGLLWLKIINSSVIKLHLPHFLKVHPTSLYLPALCALLLNPLLPPWLWTAPQPSPCTVRVGVYNI